ncbi:MAG: hypothetical protein MI724_09945 [Spirochaetales bacterium]|nr:hypothetical protein [Spirochaetales bacterium]
MKRIAQLGFVGLCLLTVSIVGADTAEDVYRESGLEYELGRLGETMVAQMNAETSAHLYEAVTADDFRTIVQTVPAAFSEEAMRADIVESIEEGLSVSQRSNALEWLRSPTGRYMTELEGVSSTPEAVEQLDEFRATNRIETLSPQRLALLERLDEAVGLTEGAADLVIGVQLGMVAGALATVPMDQDTRLDQMLLLASQLEAARTQIAQQMERQLASHIAFTYAEADDEQLTAYIEFLESDVGTHYSTVLSDALKDALFEAALRFGRLLAEGFGTNERTL